MPRKKTLDANNVSGSNRLDTVLFQLSFIGDNTMYKILEDIFSLFENMHDAKENINFI